MSRLRGAPPPSSNRHASSRRCLSHPMAQFAPPQIALEAVRLAELRARYRRRLLQGAPKAWLSRGKDAPHNLRLWNRRQQRSPSVGRAFLPSGSDWRFEVAQAQQRPLPGATGSAYTPRVSSVWLITTSWSRISGRRESVLLSSSWAKAACAASVRLEVRGARVARVSRLGSCHQP
jgi:hypothetical protein